MKPLLLAFFAGVIGACGFAPVGWWPLTILAFAALLWLVDRAPSLRSALARGYWFAAGHFMLGLNWIATAFTYQAAMPAWLGWLAVVLLSFYLAVYPAMAAGLAWRWSSAALPLAGEGEARSAESEGESRTVPHPGASRLSLSHKGERDYVVFILIFAAAWIVTEWLRATMFTGFAWNPEGIALLPTAAASTARLIGTYGLSGLLMLIAGILFLLVSRARRAATAVAIPVALLVLAAQLGFGPTPPDRDIPVRIVQPNISQDNKWRDDVELENFRRHVALSVDGGLAPGLLLWPEVAITWPMQDERRDPAARVAALNVRQALRTIIAPGGLMLTGGTAILSADGISQTGATNSVFAVDSSGEILGRFDKAHLTPYGEYLPMRPLLSAIGLEQLAPGGDTDPGPGPRTIDLPLVGAVGFQICYEIIFSGQVIEPGRRPRFIFNPSNDAWFGRWGPPQHLAQARLRALEEGLPVLRSTPTGISAVIDADGRLRHQLGWRVAGRIDAPLPDARAPTPFARIGNLLPFGLALFLVLAAVAVRRMER